jgi:hypothetical protein
VLIYSEYHLEQAWFWPWIGIVIIILLWFNRDRMKPRW